MQFLGDLGHTDEEVSEYGDNNLNKQSRSLILVKYALEMVLEAN